MRKFSRKTTIIAASLALVVATSVVAYAFWADSGTGTGEGTTGDTDSITVKQTSTVEGLFPGGPAAELSGNFDNPNDSGVFVHQVTATVASVDGGSDPVGPACGAGDFIVGAPDIVNAEVGPGNDQGSWGPITLQMVDAAYNQENCKNATVHLSYSSD